MRIVLSLLFVLAALFQAHSKTQVKVEIANYPSDTLILGYYYWDKQYIKDSLFREDDTKPFVIEYEENLPHGMYLLITQPENNFVQFVLDDDQKFKISWDYTNPFETIKFDGSDENEIFQNYISFLSDARESAEKLQAREDFAPHMRDSLNLVVEAKQQEILNDHPKSMAALVIRTNEEVEIPKLEGEEDSQDRIYKFYLNHFLDNVDFTDERLPYTSFFFNKVDRYMKKVVMQIPDSINNALDRILIKSNPSDKAFKAILIHYLNEYANSEYVGMDGVYVHLVDKYYASGMATWVDEESLNKMIDDANGLRPILIGKTAPDITLKQRDGTSLVLHEIEAEYLVLVFWAPDCGHCKKSMPKLVDLYPDLKEEGVEVLAVCTKLLDKEASCWEFVDEKGTDLWLNATDKYLKSRFKQKYNIKSTPQIFVLDKDKKIVTKKIGIEKVPEIIELLKEMEQDEQG